MIADTPNNIFLNAHQNRQSLVNCLLMLPFNLCYIDAILHSSTWYIVQNMTSIMKDSICFYFINTVQIRYIIWHSTSSVELYR